LSFGGRWQYIAGHASARLARASPRHASTAGAAAGVLAAGCASLPEGVPAAPGTTRTRRCSRCPDGRHAGRRSGGACATPAAPAWNWPDGRSYEGELARRRAPRRGDRHRPRRRPLRRGDWSGRHDRHGHGAWSRRTAAVTRAPGVRISASAPAPTSPPTAPATRVSGPTTGPTASVPWKTPDGGSYTGEWSDGARHGYGRLEEPSGLVYEGTWRTTGGTASAANSGPTAAATKASGRTASAMARAAKTRAGRFVPRRYLGGEPDPGPRPAARTTGIEISGMWNNDTVSTGLLTLPTGPEYAGPLFADAGPRRIAAAARLAAPHGRARRSLRAAPARHAAPRPGPTGPGPRSRPPVAGPRRRGRHRRGPLPPGPDADEPRPAAGGGAAVPGGGQGHAEANRCSAISTTRAHGAPQPRPRGSYYDAPSRPAASRPATIWPGCWPRRRRRVRDGERAVALIRPIALHTGQLAASRHPGRRLGSGRRLRVGRARWPQVAIDARPSTRRARRCVPRARRPDGGACKRNPRRSRLHRFGAHMTPRQLAVSAHPQPDHRPAPRASTSPPPTAGAFSTPPAAPSSPTSATAASGWRRGWPR
jgi:hypothetical protein